jgi:hypothetical protein
MASRVLAGTTGWRRRAVCLYQCPNAAREREVKLAFIDAPLQVFHVAQISIRRKSATQTFDLLPQLCPNIRVARELEEEVVEQASCRVTAS